MNNWESVRFENAPLEIIDGDRGVNYPKQSDFMTSGYCLFLNTGNVTEVGFDFSGCSFINEAKDNKLRKGKLARYDVVLTTRGTVGNLAFYDDRVPFENLRINSGMVIFRPNKEKLFPRYLYFILKSSIFKEQVSAFTTGSAQPQLPIRDINRIEFPLPPLPEQRAIAEILGALDDKIELNRRMNATLESMARAVFRQWFVENEEVGDWEIVALPEIIEVNPSRSLKKGNVAPYLDMANMPMQGHRGIEWIDRPFGSGTKFINGDTLLARITPCLENGKTAFVDFLKDGQVGWGSTEYIVLHPKPPLPPEYGYYLARSEELRNHAIQNMTGTSGRQRTPASCFDSFMIVKPSVELAKKFGEFAKSVIEKVRANDQESRTLVSLRDSLLPKLMRGEVRVKA